MAVVEAIANNTRAIMILNTANRSALPFLDERAVVEVPCIVGRTGPVPVAVGTVPAHAQALMTAIKDVERTTIQAAQTGSQDLAIRALALHPLVPSVQTARDIFAGYRAQLPGAEGAVREMSVDVVVTATAFMDITFIGLESVPRPGEERFAGDLLRSPGGGAINAVGVSRLGLTAALAVPLGEDLDGSFIRDALEREGIALSTGAGTRTPTTVVMPWGGERAMVTFEPGASTSAAEVSTFDPRAVIVALDQLDLVPPGVRRLRDLRRRRRPRLPGPPARRPRSRPGAVREQTRGAR